MLAVSFPIPGISQATGRLMGFQVNLQMLLFHLEELIILSYQVAK